MKINDSKSARKYLVGVVAFGLFLGSATLASGAINSSASGYNFCVNNTTKIVTFPAATKCPKGSTLINFGAQGAAGANGENGAAGLQGAKGDTGASGTQGLKGDTGLPGLPGLNGLNGTSLLGGVGFPNNTLGNNGDMYIDKNGAVIFGPKTAGLWGYGTAFGGPAGATGPKGETGAAGAAGAAGTGPLYVKTVNQLYLTTTSTAVASLSLPAGSYMLTFSAMAFADSGTDYAGCRIEDTDTGGSSAIMVSRTINDGRAWITRIAASTLNAPATVSAYCYKIYGGSTVTSVQSITFTAVQVSSVTVQ